MPSSVLILKFMNLAISQPTYQFQSVGQLLAERCCTWP
ncbi:Protein of unknown function [Lactobacillus delbrueckii subsp. lactis]|nr:Protein of unknown function [Lactobacillus delbrueckii subsp. lactis]